jgi:glyoxylase-like metal-dependent hydrolase (beta-lactamase superfamily II)
VAAHTLLAGFVRDVLGFRDRENAYQDAILALHGTPAGRRAAFWDAIEIRKTYWNGPVEVDHVLDEGDTIAAGGRTLRVSLRPGHSPTDTVFLDDEERVAYAADHLLPHISSNPLASRPLVGDDDPRARRSSLRMYLDSLERTAEDDLVEVRPGHGRVVDDHRHLIALRRRGHEERVEEVAAAMPDRAATAREIADAIWPGIAITQTYLTLCETLGALDLLEEQGRVRQHDDGEVIRWERARAGA